MYTSFNFNIFYLDFFTFLLLVENLYSFYIIKNQHNFIEKTVPFIHGFSSVSSWKALRFKGGSDKHRGFGSTVANWHSPAIISAFWESLLWEQKKNHNVNLSQKQSDENKIK